ncbi:hypothetical protein OS493_024200 [Desmophyllum pertusum]|uniref:Major facilitator superfamily associated domain-containing protein n=1 Tax=Desmophyllum pertusum TaxID=174260 RepID=A0A9X0CWL4_9CNID|nr:hypothetical protein OS493_024200 [Desmophyllum pertusum]
MEAEKPYKRTSSGEMKEKSSFLERFKIFGCTVDLFHYKVLFFASYGAFGCLMTFIPLYFKQLGLSAAQTGILVGLRPLCQAIGAPFWGILADKYKRRKAILLLGAAAWLIKNMLILVVRPSHQVCVATVGNGSHIVKMDSMVDSQENVDIKQYFTHCFSIHTGSTQTKIFNSSGQWRALGYILYPSCPRPCWRVDWFDSSPTFRWMHCGFPRR